MRTGTSLIVIVAAFAGLMALGFLFWRMPFNGAVAIAQRPRKLRLRPERPYRPPNRHCGRTQMTCCQAW